MKCFLVGSKELSVRVLEVLVKQGHEVKGVLSRDHEEGMKVWLGELGHRSLKQKALELGIPVYEKLNINSPEMLEALAGMKLDIMFSVFWGEMLKEQVLNLPRLGCFNLHTAYLPKNRGSFPMAWAMIRDEGHAGLTIHKMLTGVDNGPVVAQVKVPLTEKTTAGSLYKEVTEAGAELFEKTLPSFADMSYTLTPQNEDESTYNPRGYPFGGQINPYWEDSRKDMFRRALDFPPFKTFSPEPPKYLEGFSKPGVRIALGFEFKSPSGSFTASAEGDKLTQKKIRDIGNLNDFSDSPGIPFTFFTSEAFLKALCRKFGEDCVRETFSEKTGNADFAWKLSFAHEKRAFSTVTEYRNAKVFLKKLFPDIAAEACMIPGNLHGKFLIKDKLLREKIPCVFSECIDLKETSQIESGNSGLPILQPFRYENGLLEIPFISWKNKTSFEDFEKLLRKSMRFAKSKDRDFFIGTIFSESFSVKKAKNFFKSVLFSPGSDYSLCSFKAISEHYRIR